MRLVVAGLETGQVLASCAAAVASDVTEPGGRRGVVEVEEGGRRRRAVIG